VQFSKRSGQTPSTATLSPQGQWRSDAQPLPSSSALWGWRAIAPGLDGNPVKTSSAWSSAHNGQSSRRSKATWRMRVLAIALDAASRTRMRALRVLRSRRHVPILDRPGQAREHSGRLGRRATPPSAQPRSDGPPWLGGRWFLRLGAGGSSIAIGRQHLSAPFSKTHLAPLVTTEIRLPPQRCHRPWPCAASSSIWMLEEWVADASIASMRGRWEDQEDSCAAFSISSARPKLDAAMSALPSARRWQARARWAIRRSPALPLQRRPWATRPGAAPLSKRPPGGRFGRGPAVSLFTLWAQCGR